MYTVGDDSVHVSLHVDIAGLCLIIKSLSLKVYFGRLYYKKCQGEGLRRTNANTDASNASYASC
jgi:hypothetical protein